MRRRAVAALLVLCAQQARAQCTLPAPDANTLYVQPAGGTPDCAEAAVIVDGESCEVQCNVGFSQGAAGTYLFSCGVGGVPTPPAPVCAACPQTGYNDTPGAAACEECPTNSQTNAPQAIAVQECLCFAGYFGDINAPGDPCTICAEDTYNEDPGSARCDDCPANSGTDGNTGSEEPGDCLCDAGHTGTVTAPDSTCTICAAGSYKTGTGDGACEDCPLDSNTAGDGSTAIDDCLCDAGHTGTIANPADSCAACEVGEYKEDPGTADCDECPADSVTSATASTAVTDCECEAGYRCDHRLLRKNNVNALINLTVAHCHFHSFSTRFPGHFQQRHHRRRHRYVPDLWRWHVPWRAARGTSGHVYGLS